MLEVVVPSVLSSLIVGMAGAWLASQKALATFEHRLTKAEEAIVKAETAIAQAERSGHARQSLLVELKTKIDLILERLIPPPTQTR